MKRIELRRLVLSIGFRRLMLSIGAGLISSAILLFFQANHIFPTGYFEDIHMGTGLFYLLQSLFLGNVFLAILLIFSAFRKIYSKENEIVLTKLELGGFFILAIAVMLIIMAISGMLPHAALYLFGGFPGICALLFLCTGLAGYAHSKNVISAIFLLIGVTMEIWILGFGGLSLATVA